MQREVEIEFRKVNRMFQVVPPGELRRQLAKRADRLVADPHAAGLDEKSTRLGIALIAHAAHAELVGEFLNDSLQVGELVDGIPVFALVKRQKPATGQRDAQPPSFRWRAVVVAEHPPDLEHRHVWRVVIGVVLQHIGQAGQQAGAQLVLLAAERVLERHRGEAVDGRRLAGDERLRLSLVQAQPGQYRANCLEVIVRGIEQVRAHTTARRRGRHVVNAKNPDDLLD